MWITILVVAVTLSLVSNIPQIMLLHKTKDSSGVSIHLFSLRAIAFGLYEAYVVHQDDWVLAVSYMPFIGILLYVVYLIRKYRK